MASPEGSTWVLDCPLMDDLSAADFADAAAGGFYWAPPPMQPQPQAAAAAAPPNPCAEINSSVDCRQGNEQPTNKRPRSESGAQPSTKACREKIRRDKLNERFLELGAILEPGKTPKMDRSAILNDAIRIVSELRSEAQNLKDSNESLQEKIKELKAEKNELRDEKQRLKAEKESLEQQIKFLNARLSLVPHPPVIPASAFTVPQGPAAGHKLMMPMIGYPGFPMWQFMPPSDVDTSDDPKSCPPVA
ncbi:transcription factor ILR3-like isoform X2 [Phragmites australis]|uniref:transcription factor ILR3-like isoform X2 n=1 Tax=Phragmites australis TaxID=29695 RepID=UPI002D7A16EF|nr:transcription factor ILR3-like isoform X2 [Phragmites australis]